MNRVSHPGFICLTALMAMLAVSLPAKASETVTVQADLSHTPTGWAVGVQTLAGPGFCSTEGDDAQPNSDGDTVADFQPSSDADPTDDTDTHDDDDDVTAADDHPSNEEQGDDREPLTSR
jgi:hypothetical protein